MSDTESATPDLVLLDFAIRRRREGAPPKCNVSAGPFRGVVGGNEVLKPGYDVCIVRCWLARDVRPALHNTPEAAVANAGPARAGPLCGRSPCRKSFSRSDRIACIHMWTAC